MNEYDTRVAVLSRSFSANPVLRAELQAAFRSVTFNDAGLSLSGDKMIDFLHGHSHAIVALERITGDVLDRLPDLKVIGKYGVGLDNVDLDACAQHDILVGWRGGVNRRSVAELTLGLAIALLRQFKLSDREIAGGVFRQIRGRQLSDRTVGLVGCGHVGKEVVRLLQPFGCTILAHDVLEFPEFYGEYGVEAVDLDSLLSRADVISLHLPLTNKSRNLIGEREFGLMRRDAVLINTARGGLIDEQALKRALQSGVIGGAALDVFSPEPPEDTELLGLSNFIATPHIGGSAAEAILAMGRAAIEGLVSPVSPRVHIAALSY